MDEDLTLARRIVAAPCLTHSDDANARVGSWLTEIAGTSEGRALNRLLADYPQTSALIAGVAEASPHVWELTRADPARLVTLLQSDPDSRFDAILAEATRAVPDSGDEAEVMRLLRRMKAK